MRRFVLKSDKYRHKLRFDDFRRVEVKSHGRRTKDAPCRLFTVPFFCTSFFFFFFTVYAVSVQFPFLTVRIVSFCNAGRNEETGRGRGSTVKKGNNGKQKKKDERQRIEERGKWGCKSSGQTHYKFITGFPPRATLLRSYKSDSKPVTRRTACPEL